MVVAETDGLTRNKDCAKTAACSHAKDEYDGCAFRVQKWQEADEEERKELGPKEDCVEECKFSFSLALL